MPYGRFVCLGVASALLFSACGGDDDKRVGQPELPDACADGGCDEDACADGGCEVDACPDGGCEVDACANGSCEVSDACAGDACEVDACADGGCAADACPDGACDAAVDAPAPRCGDGNIDPGEVCDDANEIDGDGCQNDCTPSQCTMPAQCNDGLFCNGVEQCRAGRCAAGTAPALDDGITCTVDTCNEAADRIDHTPNNTLCSSLNTAPRCAASGPFAGRLTRQVGVCQARGCAAVEQLVDDCLDDAKYPTTFLCAATPSRILRRDGACLSTPTARCGYTDTVQTQCSTAIPSPHPFCSGSAGANNLRHHYNALATCSGTPPACGYTESTTACGRGNPTCAAGRLTTFTPTCSASGGCARQANPATSCPVGAPVCASVGGRPVRRTYAAACASGTACASPGTPTDSACPASAATCGGTPATRTTYTATCSGAGVCGQTAAAQACPDQPSVCQADPTSGILRLTSYTPACAGTACGTPTASTRTCQGRFACSGRTLQRFAPACTASTDFCGPATTPSSTQNCALADSVTCVPVGRTREDLVTVTGACDATNGQCTQSTTTVPCRIGNECVDSLNVRTHSGCGNSTTCQSSVRACNQVGCFFGNQIWQETGCAGNFCESRLVRTCDQRRCLPNGDAEQETGCAGSTCTVTIVPRGCVIN